VIRVETPAGAGYGDPFLREPEQVLADVVAGKVSLEGAGRLYGVVIREGRIDLEQTRMARSRAEKHGEKVEL
jgi:N-methylhydantoinase B